MQQAMALQEAGKFAEAEACYTQLLAEWPDMPTCWYNLGFVQRRTGHFEEALASYGQALKRGIARPEEVHLNRAVIYAGDLRRDDDAEQELGAALRLNPRYVPALLNLANLNEDHGNLDEAHALYESILSIDPGCNLALARYAGLRTVSGSDDPLIGRLRHAIAYKGSAASDKSDLGFALGRLLDGCGAYDQAFEAYAAANRHSRESMAVKGPVYDRRRHEQFIDQIIKAFPANAAIQTAGASSNAPIFICGMFRSGSTLTEQVLASHPRVTAGGEIDFIPALVQSELAPFPSAMTRLGQGELEQFAARYRDRLSALFPHAKRITDKRPDNFLYIGLIKSMFPNARIVHTTRNPPDNCLSVFFLHLDQNMGYALDLMDTGHYYRQYRRLMAHWKILYGADILDFDYDAFVRKPKPAVENLLAFCGLEWDENCLQFHRAKNAVKTASVWQVREPLYQRSSGRSQFYQRHLRALSAYLADLSREI